MEDEILEKAKVQNPLTIIAIFAGIAEVTGTTVLLGLPLEIQKIFIWFVIVFPLILIIAFFLILYFKRDALYAPSDFNNEEYFLQLLKLKDYKYQREIEEVSEIVKEVKQLTVPSTQDDKSGEGEAILSEVKEKLEALENKIDYLQRESSDNNTQKASNSGMNLSAAHSSMHYKVMDNLTVKEKIILDFLRVNPDGLTLEELKKMTGEMKILIILLNILVSNGKIKNDGDRYFYLES